MKNLDGFLNIILRGFRIIRASIVFNLLRALKKREDISHMEARKRSTKSFN
jgi:hypothetical protein